MCRHFAKKSLAFMREQSKYNIRCATRFFGEILRIEKKSALSSHVLPQKSNCEELIKLNCYEQNFLSAYL